MKRFTITEFSHGNSNSEKYLSLRGNSSFIEKNSNFDEFQADEICFFVINSTWYDLKKQSRNFKKTLKSLF